MPFIPYPQGKRSGFAPEGRGRPQPAFSEEDQRLKESIPLFEFVRGFFGGFPESLESFRRMAEASSRPPGTQSELAKAMEVIGHGANIIQAPFSSGTRRLQDALLAQSSGDPREAIEAAAIATAADVLGPQAAISGIPGIGRLGTEVTKRVGPLRRTVEKLGKKEALRETLRDIEEQAPRLAPRTIEAQQAFQLAQREQTQAQAKALEQKARLERARAVPKPPPVLELDPLTMAAERRLEQFPLRLEPTTEKADLLGQKFIGQGSEIGLFRAAAKKIKDSFSERVEPILGPRGVSVTTIEPLERAAREILPQTRISGLTTRTKGIAAEIIETVKGLPLTDIEKAELIGDDIRRTLESLPRGTAVSLGDLVDLSQFKTTGEAFKGYMAEIGVPRAKDFPTIHDVHFERSILRSVKRAADKSGQPLVKREANILERGFTETLEQSLGPQRAESLRQWDRDYAYAVRNLFGHDSLPSKLTRNKAEDFAGSLFKTTGKGRIERVERTVELLDKLNPTIKQELGENLLQTVTNKSQRTGLTFNPVEWGKEYLKYDPRVTGALFTGPHQRDLDAIARTFVRARERRATLESTRKGAIEVRQAAIEQAQRDYVEATRGAREAGTISKATEQRAAEVEKALSTLRSAKGEAERELRELTRPAGFEAALPPLTRYATHRMAWGALIMGAGHEMGRAVVTEAGALIVGASALQALIRSELGAKVVRQLMVTRPKTERAMRLAVVAGQLLKQEDLSENEPFNAPSPPQLGSSFVPLGGAPQ